MIRTFKEEDLDVLMKLWLDCNIEAHDFIDQSYWLNNFDEVKRQLPLAQVYVYEDNHKPIGFIGISNGYIAGLFICKKMQSKGIGKQLVSYVKQQYDYLFLHVYSRNERAFNFYLKQGFTSMKNSLDENGQMELEMEWKHVNQMQ